MKSLILFFTLFVSYSASIAQDPKKGYLLSANIVGLPDGESIYLVSRDVDTIAVAKSRNGKFQFKGHVDGEANFFFLQFSPAILTNAKNSWSNAIWLENKPIKLEGALSDIKKLKATGSTSQTEFLAAKHIWDTTPETERIRAAKGFVSEHLNSAFIPYFILQLQYSLYRPGEVDKVFASLGKNAKSSFYGKELGKQIEMQGVGKILNFKITDPKGEMLDINELAAKSKYTLIDFWASWCSPCRAAIPNLKRAYDAFSDKGFNIIGVSTDKSESAWKKALGEDKTPWTHGLDNIDAAANKIFGLAAIPGYILIDQNGRIIQSNLITATSLNPNKDGQIRTFKDKNLSGDLYQIIEELLKEKKGE